MFTDAEHHAMTAALAAALGGVRGANPLVGAVILDADAVPLATGHHRGAGTPHAEADAIAALGAMGRAHLRDATMLVTLEPCNHTGRTGPCARAIINAGIGRVIYAVDDPHDPAAGGADTLRKAGVEVLSGLKSREARALNARWFAAVEAARPYTTLHLAQTLDAKIAAADGTSQWISGPESLAHSHALRSRIDAILVGTGTVLTDNPRLTARTPDGSLAARQPLRAVMGLRAIPDDAAVRGDGNFVRLPTRDPAEASAELYRRGVRHLLIEGGSRISGAFLAADLVDEIVVYLAPTLLGAGTPALADLGITTLADARRWSWDPAGDGPAVALGADLKLSLIPAAPAAATTAGGR
jgi:diaminohydroxyphosphoribosylaminopyrimidine deaminase/5-amino-6-(5-phosphoribosylamino)uracil reductase